MIFFYKTHHCLLSVHLERIDRPTSSLNVSTSSAHFPGCPVSHGSLALSSSVVSRSFHHLINSAQPVSLQSVSSQPVPSRDPDSVFPLRPLRSVRSSRQFVPSSEEAAAPVASLRSSLEVVTRWHRQWRSPTAFVTPCPAWKPRFCATVLLTRHF